MKKLIISALLLMSGVAFANAQVAGLPQATLTEQNSIENGYKTIALTDLDEAVQGVVNNLAGDAFEVKTVEYDAAKELAKVTLVNKADKSEKCVIFDKEGKEVAEAPAAEAPVAEVVAPEAPAAEVVAPEAPAAE